VEADDDILDAPGPSELAPRQRGTRAALDLLHFFTVIEFPTAAKDSEKVQRVCVLCM
jgi:hypothetical protein